MKSEPNVYSLNNLQQDEKSLWDGVRNYQARNFLMQMQKGDLAFFYHSNTTHPGIVGLMQIIESGIIDPSQFDVNSSYYDPKSTPECPRWQTVKVEFVETFPLMVSLAVLKQLFTPEELWLVRRGNRLSVMPVEEKVAAKILLLGKSKKQITNSFFIDR